LPEAHVEAPTEGSIILAGLLLKLGTFGFLKWITLPLTFLVIPFLPFINIFLICSVLYCSMSIIRQIDIKRIIAYSSVIHMNLTILGLTTLTNFGISGGIFSMLAHGLTSSALFLIIGFLYERFYTRVIYYLTGLSFFMPFFSFIFLFLLIANSGFPGLCNFVGEFLIFISLFKTTFFLA
jgi:NADH:ubiquinone oxidoreductase subunit 4 (subunit M)